jgi:hypothetical protein
MLVTLFEVQKFLKEAIFVYASKENHLTKKVGERLFISIHLR